MDFSSLGSITFSWEFVSSLLSIVFINIILSGDNAVPYAMAVLRCRELSAQRVLFSVRQLLSCCGYSYFFAAQLLQVSFIKLIGVFW